MAFRDVLFICPVLPTTEVKPVDKLFAEATVIVDGHLE